MTIQWFHTRDYERCSRLAFGVPLEDVFPAGDIHPSLRELFTIAYENVVLCGYPFDEIISKFQGSIDERLHIKENVTLCKEMPGVASPGALLWVIRHFIGLLPLPLLPCYTDAKSFNWKRLSLFCKQSLLRCTDIERGNKLLVRKIAEELFRLPPQNVLLFGVLLNFIRTLCIKRIHTSHIDKFAALCLLRYFCSSIFIRPYRPECNKNVDNVYIPFLLYVLVKWPEIEKIFQEKVLFGETCCNTTYNMASKFLQRPNFISKLTPVGIQLNNTKPILQCCQANSTEPYESQNAFAQTESCKSVLSSISEESVETINFLRDTGCQTEITFTGRRNARRYQRCCCKYGGHYEVNLRDNVDDVISEDKIIQTDSEGSSCIDMITHGPSHPKKENHVPLSQFTTKPSYYGWTVPRGTSIKEEIENISPKSFITEAEYFDDGYNNSNLDLLPDENKLETNLMLSRNKEAKTCDPKVLARVSKIGWTYTPPTSLTSHTPPSQIALKDENYLLYFNEKESADREEKDACSSSSKSDTKGVLLQECASGSSTRSRKSFGLGKIKSSLDFLKIFSKRKSTVTTSSSLEEVSNIKYKKMNSAKSNIF